MDLDFSFSSIFAGFVFGVIGIYLIKAGRNSANVWHIGIGFALCVYPYLVSGAWLIWGIGALLVGVAYRMR